MCDMEQAVEEVRRVVAEAPPLAQGMARLCDCAAAQCPDPAWAAIKGLDFSADEAVFCAWLERVLAEHPLPNKMQAIWFGLYQAAAGVEGGDGFELIWLPALGAARQRPEDAEDIEWACQLDYHPQAEPPELMPPSLAMVAPPTQEAGNEDEEEDEEDAREELEELADTLLPLGYYGLLVARARLALGKRFPGGGRRPVAVGFDDGDWVYVVQP